MDRALIQLKTAARVFGVIALIPLALAAVGLGLLGGIALLARLIGFPAP